MIDIQRLSEIQVREQERQNGKAGRIVLLSFQQSVDEVVVKSEVFCRASIIGHNFIQREPGRTQNTQSNDLPQIGQQSVPLAAEYSLEQRHVQPLADSLPLFLVTSSVVDVRIQPLLAVGLVPTFVE